MIDPDEFPAAWAFLEATTRWKHNLLELPRTASPEPRFLEYPGRPTVALPPPARLEAKLEDALHGRVSCRCFGRRPLALAELGLLLHWGYGVLGLHELEGVEEYERPVPSGGALYPLELYVIARDVAGLAPGVHHYLPVGHLLEELVSVAVPRGVVGQLFLDQPYVEDAAAVVVIAAVPARTMHKYRERGLRYILFEAGHVAQNLMLVATACGLGALPLGGFFDRPLAGMLVPEPRIVPLYAVAAGPAGATDRRALRGLR